MLVLIRCSLTQTTAGSRSWQSLAIAIDGWVQKRRLHGSILAIMGNCVGFSHKIVPEFLWSNTSPSMSFKNKKNVYSPAERAVIQQFLKDFDYHTRSTPEERELAAWHWNLVFKDAATDSQRSRGRRNASKLYTAFYQHIESHSPELKALFTTSLSVRGRVLTHIGKGIGTILNTPIHEVDEYIAVLTHTHTRMGVQPEHFGPLGLALIHAMAQVSGPMYWTSEIDEAWRHMFCDVSVLLLTAQCAKVNGIQGPSTAMVHRHSLASTISQDSSFGRRIRVFELLPMTTTGSNSHGRMMDNAPPLRSARSSVGRSVSRLLPVDESD